VAKNGYEGWSLEKIEERIAELQREREEQNQGMKEEIASLESIRTLKIAEDEAARMSEGMTDEERERLAAAILGKD
jgi:ribosome-binding ATPase YchF (GTP1/OBG family)